MSRRANGEGSIYKRKDGRWAAAVYVTLSDGSKKRKTIVGRVGDSHEDVRLKLDEIKEQERKRIPFPDQQWTVGAWLDHWIEHIAPSNARRNTIIDYEASIRLYLKPALGNKFLEMLSVRDVQIAVSRWQTNGVGVRTIHKNRMVLSAALNRAVREEMIFRNVASLATLPRYKAKIKSIWTVEQQLRFFEVAKTHRWYIGFLEGFVYGMRQGEILGLRWCDIDFQNNLFHIRQQLQCLDGKIQAVPLKTESSYRTLPLSKNFKALLLKKALQDSIDIENCFQTNCDHSLDGLVLTSKVGTPIGARNFIRVFDMLIEKAGLPKIPFHTSRHIAATTHKNVGTPLRDAQGILGHSNSDITRMIYQHGDIDVQRKAIESTENLLYLGNKIHSDDNCCQKLLSDQYSTINTEKVKDKKDPFLTFLRRSDTIFKMGRTMGIEPTTFGTTSRQELPFYPIPTSVVKHLYVAMRTQILGAIAVKTAVIFLCDNGSLKEAEQVKLKQYIALHYACGEILLKNKFNIK